MADEAGEERFTGQNLPGKDVGQSAALELVAADVANLEGRVLVRQSQVLKMKRIKLTLFSLDQ